MTRAILMLCLLAGMAFAQKPNEARYEKKGALDDDAVVRVEHVAGTVRIDHGNQGEFRVEATVRVVGVSDEKAKERLQKVRVDIDAQAKALTVKTVFEQESGLEALAQLFRSRDDGNIEVDYVIHVGGGPRVDVESVSGEVAVRPRKGPSAVKTVSGPVAMEYADKPEIRTVSGPVELKEPRGPWSIETVSGSVDVLLDHFGQHEGKATTTSGAITLRAHPKAAADLKVTTATVSGAVKNEIGEKGAKAVALKTVSGAITATLHGN